MFFVLRFKHLLLKRLLCLGFLRLLVLFLPAELLINFDLCFRREQPHEHGPDIARAVHRVSGRGRRRLRRRRGHRGAAARNDRRRHQAPLRQPMVRQDCAGERRIFKTFERKRESTVQYNKTQKKTFIDLFAKFAKLNKL